MPQGLSRDPVSVLRHLRHSPFLKGPRSGTVLREGGQSAVRLGGRGACLGVTGGSRGQVRHPGQQQHQRACPARGYDGASSDRPGRHGMSRGTADLAPRRQDLLQLRRGVSCPPRGSRRSGRQAAEGADPPQRFLQLMCHGGALLCPEGKGPITGKAKGRKSPRGKLLAWEMFCFSG